MLAAAPMRKCAIGLVVFGVLVMLSSMVPTAGEHDMFTGIGVIKYSPRLGMTTADGRYGITEYSMQSPSGGRKFETYFHWGLHFVTLPFSASLAAALVAMPTGCVGVFLLYSLPRREDEHDLSMSS